jgi:hypothetical protein
MLLHGLLSTKNVFPLPAHTKDNPEQGGTIKAGTFCHLIVAAKSSGAPFFEAFRKQHITF